MHCTHCATSTNKTSRKWVSWRRTSRGVDMRVMRCITLLTSASIAEILEEGYISIRHSTNIRHPVYWKLGLRVSTVHGQSAMLAEVIWQSINITLVLTLKRSSCNVLCLTLYAEIRVTSSKTSGDAQSKKLNVVRDIMAPAISNTRLVFTNTN